jgi:tRNA-splicing endonuclease subunit Sen34
MEPSQDDWSHFVPDLPIPISFIGGRYLLFDVKAVSYLRREHKLCGYNIGTLPQSPSQNVFLGLPTIIMPEEAQLLIDQGFAYLLDDASAHDKAVYTRNQARKAEFMAKIRRQANEVEKIRAQEQEAAKRKALGGRTNASSKDKPDNSTQTDSLLAFDDEDNEDNTTSTSQRASISDSPIKLLSTPPASLTYHITPTTSRPLLDTTSAPDTSILPPTKPIPNLPPSYPLFRHLHSRGYFMTPGLRFGCQYTVYPGDPLRFHSHFLAVGVEWEEPIDLMEIVGGGRLGTGVKKGFLIGGEERGDDEGVDGVDGKEGTREQQIHDVRKVRTFSVEWAVM